MVLNEQGQVQEEAAGMTHQSSESDQLETRDPPVQVAPNQRRRLHQEREK
jgi:hypothetical protein